MTKITFGAVVVSAAGKLGGHVFARSAYGGTIRTKSIPVNKNTRRQQNIRSKFRHLATSWRLLSEAQRLTWYAAVPSFLTTNVFGNSYAPSGQLLFTRLNMNLLNINRPVINVAPIPVRVQSPKLTSILVVKKESILQVRWVVDPSTQILLFSFTRPLSKSVKSVKNQFVIIGNPVSQKERVVSLFTAYANRFGIIPVTSAIICKATPINRFTGQAGIPRFITASIRA